MRPPKTQLDLVRLQCFQFSDQLVSLGILHFGAILSLLARMMHYLSVEVVKTDDKGRYCLF